jgi:cell division protein FtsW (lipid II flippase)
MSFLLETDPALLFWSLAVLHLVGLASIFFARLPRAHRLHLLCHHGFFACLLFVGVVTMCTILTRSNWWVWSGTTFSLMAVGATADLGPATS